MKPKVMMAIIAAGALGLAGAADADIVELDLFSLGCPTEFNAEAQYWTTDVDLGTISIGRAQSQQDWLSSTPTLKIHFRSMWRSTHI